MKLKKKVLNGQIHKKNTNKSNELKEKLKKIKSNGHLTQKRTETSSLKSTQQSKFVKKKSSKKLIYS